MVEPVKDMEATFEVERLENFYEVILIALDLPMASSLQEANGLISQYMESHPDFDMDEAID